MLDELFENIESDILTPSVKLQMSAIFESSLNEAIKQKEEELEESNKKEILEFRNELSEQIDKYLSYIVEEFIKENESIIDNKVKVKMAEKVLTTFSNLVNDFNVELTNKSLDESYKISELEATISKLENKLFETKNENEDIKKAAKIFEFASENCETELEKDIFIESAVEAVKTFKADDEIFTIKLQNIFTQIKESQNRNKKKIPDEINESKSYSDTTIATSSHTSSMSEYLKYLKKN